MKIYHGSRLRLGRCSLVNQIYLVTFTVRGRVSLFEDFSLACVASSALSGPLPGARMLAWVLMPDHFHGLIQLGESSLGEVVRLLKGQSSRRVNEKRGCRGAVWQAGYHDRALRKGEDVRAAARYIVGNPVRAGLVESVREYSYWDAIWVLE